MITLTGDDYRVVQQPVLDIRLRFEIYDKYDNYIDSIDGAVINGSASIDAESDIRRSFSITVIPDYRSRIIISEQGYIWVNKFIRIYLSIIDMQTGEPREYKFGKFLFTNTSTTYDPTNNQMTINCSDLMAMLDGSKNGELGQLNIVYPAYEEDEEGHPTHFNKIRTAVIDTISQLGRIKDYEIDEIGEYNAMPMYNTEWAQYRIDSIYEFDDGHLEETWDTIPFDQTFSAGTTVLNIITTFRDLYPNYEAYFDENGVFCMNMIPSGDEDPIIIENDFFQDIYISENTNIDMTQVRNVSHVWGQVLDTDFYTDESRFDSNTYFVEYEGYEDEENKGYKNGDKIAFKVFEGVAVATYTAFSCETESHDGDEEQQIPGYSVYNITVINEYYMKVGDKIAFKIDTSNYYDSAYLKINRYDKIPIYQRGTTDFIEEASLEPNTEYVVEIAQYDGQHPDEFVAYLLGTKQETGVGLYVQVNNLPRIPIYDENTEDFLIGDKLVPGNTYVFKIKNKNRGEFRAYWLGAWQAQGIVALVADSVGGDMLYVNTEKKNSDGVLEGYFNLDDLEFYENRTYDEEEDKYIYSDMYDKMMGIAYYDKAVDAYYRVVRKYSREYFECVYACPTVRLRVIPQSPFTCQKIGEYMDVMTDDKNITSSSLAASRADWEVYKQARLLDSITITTKFCPFADVNIKVAYRRHDLKRINPYIVKNVSHDFSGGTTTWQLMRFYPLYERLNLTHDELYDDDYIHDELAAFTHERI